MCMKAYEIPLSLYYYIERKEELQKANKQTSPPPPKKTITLASNNQPPTQIQVAFPIVCKFKFKPQTPKAKNPLIALRCSLFGLKKIH